MNKRLESRSHFRNETTSRREIDHVYHVEQEWNQTMRSKSKINQRGMSNSQNNSNSTLIPQKLIQNFSNNDINQKPFLTQTAHTSLETIDLRDKSKSKTKNLKKHLMKTKLSPKSLHFESLHQTSKSTINPETLNEKKKVDVINGIFEHKGKVHLLRPIPEISVKIMSNSKREKYLKMINKKIKQCKLPSTK